jgi:heme/copper-type cytochrome/quinol oxidase subunit 3
MIEPKMDNPDETAIKERVDYSGAKMGMWIFLFTEVLFFGVLFLLYSVFRSRYAMDFHASAKELDIFFGTANTAILLTSSFRRWPFDRTGEKGKKRPLDALPDCHGCPGYCFSHQ